METDASDHKDIQHIITFLFVSKCLIKFNRSKWNPAKGVMLLFMAQ